jgi:hypothetical protein
VSDEDWSPIPETVVQFEDSESDSEDSSEDRADSEVSPILKTVSSIPKTVPALWQCFESGILEQRRFDSPTLDLAIASMAISWSVLVPLPSARLVARYVEPSSWGLADALQPQLVGLRDY